MVSGLFAEQTIMNVPPPFLFRRFLDEKKEIKKDDLRAIAFLVKRNLFV